MIIIPSNIGIGSPRFPIAARKRKRWPIVMTDNVRSSGLAANMLAGWNFESVDATDTPADFGGSAYDFPINSSPTIVPGLINNAIDFGGGTLGFGAPPAAMYFPSGVMCGAFWIKINNLPGGTVDLISSASANAGTILRLDATTGIITLFVGIGSGYTSLVANLALAIDSWMFIFYGFDANNLYLSVSDETELVATQTTPIAGTYSPPSGTYVVQGTEVGAQYDTMVLYSGRVLSDADVASVFNDGAGRALPF